MLANHSDVTLSVRTSCSDFNALQGVFRIFIQHFDLSAQNLVSARFRESVKLGKSACYEIGNASSETKQEITCIETQLPPFMRHITQRPDMPARTIDILKFYQPERFNMD